MRHIGGGCKQNYRKIDFKRKYNNSFVIGFDYDPNRSVFLAKMFNSSNTLKLSKGYYYILAPKGLMIFDRIQTIIEKKKNLNLNIGDCTILSNFEVGDFIHNVSNSTEGFPIFAKTAGTFCQILDRFSNKYIKVLLPSGTQRLIISKAKATFGVLSNENFNKKNLIKAGRTRWLNIRPSVRGVAMNPIDHPHGGGQGKTKGGRPSVTPWARPTKGLKTKNRRQNNKLIFVLRNKDKLIYKK